MEAVIQKLLEGFKTFQSNYFEKDVHLYTRLKEGQRPKVLVIACSDSRVDPALLTSSDPGDMFVVRNIANLVPPYQPDEQHHGVSAALEYAVNRLGVKHIIIMGHSDCGGINALMARDKLSPKSEFIDPWLDVAEPAKVYVQSILENAPESTQLRACEEASIILSMENLFSFPWIKERVEKRELFIHGWYFHLASGHLYGFDVDDKHFVPIDSMLPE